MSVPKEFPKFGAKMVLTALFQNVDYLITQQSLNVVTRTGFTCWFLFKESQFRPPPLELGFLGDKALTLWTSCKFFSGFCSAQEFDEFCYSVVSSIDFFLVEFSKGASYSPQSLADQRNSRHCYELWLRTTVTSLEGLTLKSSIFRDFASYNHKNS